MKNTRARSLVVYILAAAFIAGIGLFVFRYVTNAAIWAIRPNNGHISDGEYLTGKIFDRNDVILAQGQNGKRIYNNDEMIRKAVLHTVGDGTAYISTSVQSRYSAQLFGYNIALGFGIPNFMNTSKNIKLTIDGNLCKIAYEKLGDRKGAVAVCNYKTGEILCLVSSPSYDPQNKPNIEKDTTGKYDGVYVNRAISSSFTPGSVFKIVTCIAGIDNIPDIDRKIFNCTQKINIEGEEITCMKNHGKINFKDAMARSCNIAFADLAMELGREKMMNTAEQLGFNTPSYFDGIQTQQSVYNVSAANAPSIGWSGIGQYSDLVNPIHMLSIVSAVANDGISARPYIVSSFSTASGITISSTAKKETRLINEHTANKMKDIMRYTVKTQYGDSMFPGLEVCAKTGTAEVGEGKQPNAWMVGFSSKADFPIAFVVVVENAGFGIKEAGPIAKAVMLGI